MNIASALALPAGWPVPSLMKRRVVILVGGDEEPPNFVRRLLHDDDVILAANGGARMALAARVVPHMLVGDIDSITQLEAASFPEQTRRWSHPATKDWSDLELAMYAAF